LRCMGKPILPENFEYHHGCRLTMSNALTISETGLYVEGPASGELMRKAEDANLVVEFCFSARTRSALLYAPNMTARFFDLSSGEAGAILQKFRTYGIRVALVCPPGSVRFSGRFGELIAEENRSPYFRFFESVEAAREWLA